MSLPWAEPMVGELLCLGGLPRPPKGKPMSRREKADSRLIFIRSPRLPWRRSLWFIPVLAFLLVLVLTLYGRKYRNLTGGMDTPLKIVRSETESLLRPLRLTALHFATLSKEFLIPKETLERHLSLLQKLAPYRTLSILNRSKGCVLAVGQEHDSQRAQSRLERLPQELTISPLMRRKRVTGLEIVLPISPVQGEPHWLVATVDLTPIKTRLREHVRLVNSSGRARNPIHPAAPGITLEIKPHARPLWPLLLGELMMALGIVLLLLKMRRREES